MIISQEQNSPDMITNSSGSLVTELHAIEVHFLTDPHISLLDYMASYVKRTYNLRGDLRFSRW